MNNCIQINPNHKEFILESLTLIDIESNEQERSIALIGDVIKAIVLALKKSGYKSYFKAQNIYFHKNKKDFITDFEIYAESSLFHIIEAKGSYGTSGAKEQIKMQMIKTNCQNGCITDGFSWQFVRLISNTNSENKQVLDVEFVGSPIFLKNELDYIFDYIFKCLPGITA